MAETFDTPEISDDEIVIRRVRPDEVVFDRELGRYRPSTQAFKQGGVEGLTSAYLMSATTPRAVAGDSGRWYLAAVRVGILRTNGLGVVLTENERGTGHVDITGRKTRGVLVRVVMAAYWVPGYGP